MTIQAADLTIQDVARRTGLSEPTLRYYESVGLIRGVQRDPGTGHRRYSAEQAETLVSLACLRSAGLRIEDMRRYLDLLAAGTPEAAAGQAALFRSQAGRVAAEIERLRVRLEYLRAKGEMWDARARGDRDGEDGATARVLRLLERFDERREQK